MFICTNIQPIITRILKSIVSMDSHTHSNPLSDGKHTHLVNEIIPLAGPLSRSYKPQLNSMSGGVSPPSLHPPPESPCCSAGVTSQVCDFGGGRKRLLRRLLQAQKEKDSAERTQFGVHTHTRTHAHRATSLESPFPFLCGGECVRVWELIH